MGHVKRPGRLELASPTTDVIRDLKTPRIVTELKSGLGLFNVYRRFISKFARIAALLNTKLKRGELKQLHHLSTEETDALATLQQYLIAASALVLPYREGYLTLDSDSCHKQLGCVLMED